MLSLLRRLRRSVFQFGIRGVLYKGYVALVDHWYDWSNSVDTVGWATLDTLTISGSNRSYGNRYEPMRVVILRRFFRMVEPIVPKQPSLVDFGAGKGRVILISSEFGYVRAVGVEFASELTAIAILNLKRKLSHHSLATKLEMVCADAAHYQIEVDQNLFTFYNPFDSSILSYVLTNIRNSLAVKPRPALIVFFNNEYSDLSEVLPGFGVVMTDSHIGYSFVVYSNACSDSRH